MVFMTQDALPADRELIQNLTGALCSDEQIGAAYARQLPNAECSFVERYTRSFNYPEISCVKTKADLPRYGIKTYFCSNVCAAYKKDIFEKLGGFVERTIFNEDMIYAGNLIQAGYGIAYAADAKVIHSHNYSCMQQFHRNFDLGVSQAEHPEIFASVKSEGEGIRLVKQTAKYLLAHFRGFLIPELVVSSGCKYLGYKLDEMPYEEFYDLKRDPQERENRIADETYRDQIEQARRRLSYMVDHYPPAQKTWTTACAANRQTAKG